MPRSLSLSGYVPSKANVPIRSIEPPSEDRLDWTDLHILIDAIASDGLCEPLAVEEIRPGRYQIVSGVRRFAAIAHLINRGETVFDASSETLGDARRIYSTVPVVVRCKCWLMN